MQAKWLLYIFCITLNYLDVPGGLCISGLDRWLSSLEFSENRQQALIMCHMHISKCISVVHIHLSRKARKPVFRVSEQIRHKPGCTATEDGQRLEIPDLGRRGIVLSVKQKKRC